MRSWIVTTVCISPNVGEHCGDIVRHHIDADLITDAVKEACFRLPRGWQISEVVIQVPATMHQQRAVA